MGTKFNHFRLPPQLLLLYKHRLKTSLLCVLRHLSFCNCKVLCLKEHTNIFLVNRLFSIFYIFRLPSVNYFCHYSYHMFHNRVTLGYRKCNDVLMITLLLIKLCQAPIKEYDYHPDLTSQ